MQAANLYEVDCGVPILSVPAGYDFMTARASVWVRTTDSMSMYGYEADLTIAAVSVGGPQIGVANTYTPIILGGNSTAVVHMSADVPPDLPSPELQLFMLLRIGNELAGSLFEQDYTVRHCRWHVEFFNQVPVVEI